MNEANKTQVGGLHYKTDAGMEEHWDRVHRLGLDYFQGQITKYVERCWKKNGLQDLQKAQHFLQKYIELHTVVEKKQEELSDTLRGFGHAAEGAATISTTRSMWYDLLASRQGYAPTYKCHSCGYVTAQPTVPHQCPSCGYTGRPKAV